MKKNIFIAVAASAMLLSATAANAAAVSAALNLDAATPTPALIYAKEITATAAAPATLTLAGTTTGQKTTVKSGLAVAAGGKAWYRFDLSGGAKFVTLPAGSVTLASTLASDVAETIVLGGAGNSFVVVEAAVAAGKSITVAEAVNLVQPDISVVDTVTPVNITYGVYATLGAASAGTNPLKTATGAKIAYANGLSATSTAVTSGFIDAATASTKFVSTPSISTVTNNTIANPTIGLSATPVFAKTGGTLTVGNAVASGVLTVNGPFDAAAGVAAGALIVPATYPTANVSIDTNNCAAAGGNTGATTLTATKATFATTSVVAGTVVCMNVNTVSTIAKGSAYTFDYVPTAATGYTTPSTLGLVGGTLVINGTTKSVFAIPAATVAGKKSFIRVTNTSNVAGNLLITVTNDAGAAILTNHIVATNLQPGATYTLGSDAAVAGVGSAAEIETAAGFVPSVATPSLWTGKARVTITGEFAGMTVQHLINSATGSPVQTNLTAVQ